MLVGVSGSGKSTFARKHFKPTEILSSDYCRGLISDDENSQAAENLERLRARGLSTKRSLALREFALGIESLERFVRKEPLRRVHEAVFGVLALESEPVDPRL
ncbi:MAG TPA: AAA family ATPase [Verrucomicrobiae bacterium]